MSNIPKHTKADEDLIKGPFIEIKTTEQLDALCDMAKEKDDAIRSEMESIVSKERAGFIRGLRVDHGCTWRSVAGNCHDEWFPDGKNAPKEWWPTTNQLIGMFLCEKAAEHFGEDYMKEPWN